MEQTLQSLPMSDIDHGGYFPGFIQNVHYHFIENCGNKVFSFI